MSCYRVFNSLWKGTSRAVGRESCRCDIPRGQEKEICLFQPEMHCLASGNRGGGLLCLPRREEPWGMKEVIFYWTKRSLSEKTFLVFMSLPIFANYLQVLGR
jgi:hypothetical protein